MPFRKHANAGGQEIWFRQDIGGFLASLASVPVPTGEYSAGWHGAILALAKMFGLEWVEDGSSVEVWVMAHGYERIGAPNGNQALEVRR